MVSVAVRVMVEKAMNGVENGGGIEGNEWC